MFKAASLVVIASVPATPLAAQTNRLIMADYQPDVVTAPGLEGWVAPENRLPSYKAPSFSKRGIRTASATIRAVRNSSSPALNGIDKIHLFLTGGKFARTEETTLGQLRLDLTGCAAGKVEGLGVSSQTRLEYFMSRFRCRRNVRGSKEVVLVVGVSGTVAKTLMANEGPPFEAPPLPSGLRIR